MLLLKIKNTWLGVAYIHIVTLHFPIKHGRLKQDIFLIYFTIELTIHVKIVNKMKSRGRPICICTMTLQYAIEEKYPYW